MNRNNMSSKIGAFECSKCGYVGPPDAGGLCPKCGGAWKHIEVYGTGTSRVAIFEVRTRNPKDINGETVNVATARAKTSDNIHDTTIQRTIDGESADLQIKFKVNELGEVELLHVHCEKDKVLSDWRKRYTGPSITEFYDIFPDNDDGSILRCKICGRKWSSLGRMQELNSI